MISLTTTLYHYMDRIVCKFRSLSRILFRFAYWDARPVIGVIGGINLHDTGEVVASAIVTIYILYHTCYSTEPPAFILLVSDRRVGVRKVNIVQLILHSCGSTCWWLCCHHAPEIQWLPYYYHPHHRWNVTRAQPRAIVSKVWHHHPVAAKRWTTSANAINHSKRVQLDRHWRLLSFPIHHLWLTFTSNTI